jgi:hypothetical protein
VLASTIKARWRKEELGLDHFEDERAMAYIVTPL